MEDLGKYIGGKELFAGHYRLKRLLSSEGGTADVWLAIDINTIDIPLDLDECDSPNKGDDASGMLVAIKIYRPKNALDVEGEQRFREEFKIVYECHHENLLQPTSFSVFEGTPYLVLPYCKHGSSEQLIGKNPSNEDIWKFILDVSSGLNRLHSNEPPIIHQDIKPANVLIDNSKNYAITDFGISSKLGGMHGFYYDEENSGTMAYMAPERFLDNVEPMAQSDIWAFGATLCEILTGNVPFGEEGGKNQLESDIQMPAIENVPADIKRLIYACLSKDIGNRPTASQLREAALARQYPIRSKKLLYWTIGIIAAVCVACILLFLPKSHKEVIPSEQLFEIALLNLNSDKADEVKRGVLLMDSLSNLNYVPAIYQMAFTYGWYNDPVSLKRKRLLGIEVIENNEKGGVNLPKLDRYSNEAVSLFLKMLELNDTTYSNLNAQAAYRLACYYVNPNPIFKANFAKAKQFLEISKGWATLRNDTLLNNINESLKTFDNN